MKTNIVALPSSVLFDAIRALDDHAVHKYLDLGGDVAAKSPRGTTAVAELLLTYRAVKNDIPAALAARARAANPDAFAASEKNWDDEEEEEDQVNQFAPAGPSQFVAATSPITDEDTVTNFIRDRTLGIAEKLLISGAPNLDSSMGSTKYAQTIDSFSKANLPDLHPALLAFHERAILGVVSGANEPSECSAPHRPRIV
jgi:hypothetical protein